MYCFPTSPNLFLLFPTSISFLMFVCKSKDHRHLGLKSWTRIAKLHVWKTRPYLPHGWRRSVETTWSNIHPEFMRLSSNTCVCVFLPLSLWKSSTSENLTPSFSTYTESSCLNTAFVASITTRDTNGTVELVPYARWTVHKGLAYPWTNRV
jgi:hypothetical protein